MTIKKFIKFGLFVWIWGFGTLLAMSLAVILGYSFGYIYIGYSLCFGLFVYGSINTFLVAKAFKYNLQVYKRLTSLQNSGKNMPKSVLYDMRSHYCSELIVKDIQKDYNIILH